MTDADEIHELHAAAYPAGLFREGDDVAFGVVHPPLGEEVACTVGLIGGVLFASRHPHYVRDGVPDVAPLRTRTPLVLGADLVSGLGLLGVGRGIGPLPEPLDDAPPLVSLLARALVASWRAAGARPEASDGDLLWEAREREQARLDEAGLGVLLTRLPDGLGRILDCRGDRLWLTGFLGWTMAREGRVEAVSRLGGLVSLVEDGEGKEDPTDHPDPESYVLERVRRWTVHTDDGRTTAGRSGARWLVDNFLEVAPHGEEAASVPTDTLHMLLRESGRIEQARLRSPSDSAALVRLARRCDALQTTGPDVRRALRVLGLVGGDEGYAGIEAAIADAGRRRGLEKGLEHLVCDGDDMRFAFHAGVILPLLSAAIAPRLPDGGSLRDLHWDATDGPALSASTGRLADEAIFLHRPPGEVIASASAWDADGRPGAPTTTRPYWYDVGLGSNEIGRRLREALADDGAARRHLAMSPYLSEGWRGGDGLSRIGVACGEIAATLVPYEGSVAKAPSGPGTAGARPSWIVRMAARIRSLAP